LGKLKRKRKGGVTFRKKGRKLLCVEKSRERDRCLGSKKGEKRANTTSGEISRNAQGFYKKDCLMTFLGGKDVIRQEENFRGRKSLPRAVGKKVEKEKNAPLVLEKGVLLSSHLLWGMGIPL